ncbi:RNA--NAD 2'-phosphotransferase [Porphyrobacter algicida]|uniref:Probable RNA 2'-phosphotransferase n=1 Tax=Qipengyuania algicida TaxID=1836209 RepID=A0A845AKW0_9SPHN|nr:RNA--NAD 2'-phosphotransferase [Qipengyuania algicida]
MASDIRLSKRLSYWLRHKPDDGNLTVDPAGWVDVDEVLAALERIGVPGGRRAVEDVVAESDKNRFELSGDGKLIRARQGHTIPVSLNWPVTEPPEILFHGTVERFVASIFSQGLKPMGRHHVHLSSDVGTARTVGARRGKPIVLRVLAGRLSAQGQEFRISGNGVWLTDHVAPAYITLD